MTVINSRAGTAEANTEDSAECMPAFTELASNHNSCCLFIRIMPSSSVSGPQR
jgi:hypothetical protein